MDRERFDALSRALASTHPRRGLLGLILTATLLGHGSWDVAATGKGKGHSKGIGQGHDTGKGQGHQSDKTCAELACEKYPVPTGEKPEFCCKGGFCSCGGRCCEGQCFQTGPEATPERVFCCTGPKSVVCQVVIQGQTSDTCCEGSCENCGAPGPSSIAGSYRRR